VTFVKAHKTEVFQVCTHVRVFLLILSAVSLSVYLFILWKKLESILPKRNKVSTFHWKKTQME
jgi:hypothetical protein